MAKNFWQGKRVLVTGHEGFLGSNLTNYLVRKGAVVTGLDIKVNRKHTLFTKEEYKQFKTIKGSVANYGLVNKIIGEQKIDIIFHLAAEAIVNVSLFHPVQAFRSNIEGTWNILDICRQTGTVETIVVASSDKAYGCHKILPYKETAPLQGCHPYDVSKSCADLIAYTYFYTYGVPVGITRCGNIYGPGDFNFSRIIPDAMRCMYKGKELCIRSDGKFTRDYVYVDDIVSGYVLLAEKLNALELGGQAFNVSDENPITVLELLKKITQISKHPLHYTILNQAKYEIRDQYLASGKARKVLGWKPRFTLEQGLKKTIEWYMEYFENNKR